MRKLIEVLGLTIASMVVLVIVLTIAVPGAMPVIRSQDYGSFAMTILVSVGVAALARFTVPTSQRES